MTTFTDSIKAFEVTPQKVLISDINRQILVDWMIEITSGSSYFFDDTVHYAVSYMDRYLTKKVSPTLQKLAATCVFIASKFNDIYPVSIEDVLYFTSTVYLTKNELLNMEADILTVLNFELAKPNIKTFILNSSPAININADKALMMTPSKKPSEIASDILENNFEIYIPSQFTAINDKHKQSKKRKLVE